MGGGERVWLGAFNAGSSSFLRRILCVPAAPARVWRNGACTAATAVRRCGEEGDVFG